MCIRDRYINDRDSAVTDYTGYGDNADRMRAIGEVFPVLFFLVAALVSLTTMTRMVEEQRTLIGTLKALGYERHAIAGKYLGYAFFATVGGCIVGVLIGEKILPYIIITAYGIMYTHMDTVIVPYHFSYAAAASLAALVCTIGATFFSCFRELREQAAELMRPPAPKQGKRVVLERVPFIWKRFSFIWKATVRNLMRYKKRFFMTIFGIGGSMALLLVGFGLQDSIFNIGILQYDKIQLYDGNVILNEDAAEQEKQDIYEALKKDDRTKKTVENLLTQVKVHNLSLIHISFEENIAQVKELVKVAHAVGVSVEAELGHVGNASNYDMDRDAALTEPELAKKFIEETGIDCLAVAIGTAHGAYNKGQMPYLDYERLAEIKKVTNNFPLVLHGGSGTGDEGLSKVAKMGINKVNIGCELFASAIDAIENADTEGNGAYGFANIIEEGYGSRLKHFIRVLDSEGKAWEVKKMIKREKIELTKETIL